MEEDITAAYRRWRPYLYTAAYRVLGNSHAAEDVVQETFLRALPHWDPARQASLRNWLLRICKRACCDWLYTFGSRRQREEYFGDCPPDLADCYTLEDVVCMRETAREVRVALRMIGPQGRRIVSLYHFQGVKYVDIARRLGISINGVKAQMWTARRQVGKRMRQMGVV